MIEIWQILRTVAAGLLIATLGPGTQEPAGSSLPVGARLGENESAIWTGGPFDGPNPTICSPAPGSTCDRFRIEVRAADGASVCVSITTGAPARDDLDLYVYTGDGELLATSTGRSGSESVAFEHRPSARPRTYEIRVQPWMVQPGTTYRGSAAVTPAPSPEVASADCPRPTGTIATGGGMS